MGTFSWLTSNTEESIMICGRPGARTVYLLQPDGKPPIKEEDYDGYGTFGDTNAYNWLARMNTPATLREGRTEDDLYDMGVSLGCGSYLHDRATGKNFSVFHDHSLIAPTLERFNVTYAEPLPGFGASANNLIESGRLVRIEFWTQFPLKFSFDPAAVYEQLPAAKICPIQGQYAD